MIRRFAPIALSLALLAGCNRGAEDQNKVDNVVALPPVVDQVGTTPMAERIAVLGLLNKRNGIVRDLTLKPGQAVRVKDVIVRLRACETSAPWETERLTGAFVQVDVQRSDKLWNRAFSGWLYKESPSLNVVEHPVYDVWPKSCMMSWPTAPGAPPSPADSTSVSSKPKSGGSSASTSMPANSGGAATPSTLVEPSAADNNAT